MSTVRHSTFHLISNWQTFELYLGLTEVVRCCHGRCSVIKMTVQGRMSRGEGVPRLAGFTSWLPCVWRSCRSVDRHGEGSLKIKLWSVRKYFFFVINLVHHLAKSLYLVEHREFLVDDLLPPSGCGAQKTSFNVLTKRLIHYWQKIKDVSFPPAWVYFFQVSFNLTRALQYFWRVLTYL